MTDLGKRLCRAQIFSFIFSTSLLLMPGIGELSAQTIPYGTGQWDRKEFGNHRAVIEVGTDAPSVLVHIPWRRIDDPAGKSVILVDASNGKSIHNYSFRTLGKEFADLAFAPSTGKGIYYLYYLPYKNTGSWYFPNTVYPTAKETADPTWISKNKGKELPLAPVLRFESVTEFDSFYPMEIVATASEMKDLLSVNKNKEFLLFPEDRKYPIRMDADLPMRWTQRKDNEPFNATAQRNEFFAFQLGIYTPFWELRNVHLVFSDLRDKQGAKISRSAIRCFNMAGTDWLGKTFTKKVDIQKGKIQPLWVGIDISSTTKPGAYEGEIEVQAEGRESRKVIIRLNVQDSVLADRGYGELFRMARLNWLDSKIGLDDSLYKPYTPVQLHGNTIRILGRELRFDRYGLPEKITSSFTGSNDRTGGPDKDILNSPMRLIALHNGKELIWKGNKPVITQKTEAAVSWETQLRNGKTLLKIAAKMECDGHIDYQVTLSAGEDMALDDIQLQIPYAHRTATYMMGLGRKGGKRPEHWDWKWDKQLANNMIWLGDMNAGLQCKLKHESPDWSLYNFSKTGTYKDWSNEGLGGCSLNDEGTTGQVMFKAFTGRKILHAGQTMHLNFGLLITPVKPLDNKHWNERYFQADPPLDNWRKEAVDKGATVMNIHQGNVLNPYINYPFLTTDTLKRYINANRKSGIRTKIYYTVRELSNYAPEIWAFRSLGDEIFTPGLGAQLADQFADDGLGGNLYAKGGPWLVEHLRTRYDAAWHTPLQGGEYDMSIRTQGLSRLHNYYLEGLGWLAKNTGMRGIYLDGVGYDREIMKRVRKVLDRSADSCLIDFHSGNNFSASYGMNSPANQYMELFPCINSLWLGEGYNYNEEPDYWLTEIAGLPFGLYSEMLNGCGNAYRGMIYGMTSRLGWLGCDPSTLWKLWDSFGIQNSRMTGYWDPAIPIKCNREDVKVTVYQQQDKILIVYASWAKENVHIRLSPDWNALKMTPAQVSIMAPAVAGLQEKQEYTNMEDISVPVGKGGFIIISKNSHAN